MGTTNWGNLTLAEAAGLYEVMRAAETNATVIWGRVDWPAVVRHARAIVRYRDGVETVSIRSDDIRDLFLKVVDDRGNSAYWHVAGLMRDYSIQRFVVNPVGV
jgi:hypothetical protein